jgi:hypothetical protein
MFECLILGDSIGVGVAEAINDRLARRYDFVAEERASVAQILSWRKPVKDHGASLHSIGSNDPAGRLLATRLAQLRQSIRSRRVIWLLPCSRQRAMIVNSIAVRFGDEALDLAQFPSRDSIHPRSYGDVAASLVGQTPGAKVGTAR